ncbi:hypothetical protein HK405_013164 [Cladochytrium tenue]|nr:hypothetical protein HK405_013164 [Cladochytrium tenue]
MGTDNDLTVAATDSYRVPLAPIAPTDAADPPAYSELPPEVSGQPESTVSNLPNVIEMSEDNSDDSTSYSDEDDTALPPVLQELATHVRKDTTLRELSGLLRSHSLPLIPPSSSKLKHHVMIIYCVQDKEVASAVAGYLKDHSYNVWVDTIKTHDHINQVVLETIQDSRVIMPLHSEAFVGSRNCKLELLYALSQSRRISYPSTSRRPQMPSSSARPRST